MTDQEKIAAFDAIATAFTNRWSDGQWSWWNPNPACGTATMRATQSEALDDMIAFAKAYRARVWVKLADRVELPVKGVP
jgi:hypothetical protein